MTENGYILEALEWATIVEQSPPIYSIENLRKTLGRPGKLVEGGYNRLENTTSWTNRNCEIEKYEMVVIAILVSYKNHANKTFHSCHLEELMATKSITSYYFL